MSTDQKLVQDLKLKERYEPLTVKERWNEIGRCTLFDQLLNSELHFNKDICRSICSFADNSILFPNKPAGWVPTFHVPIKTLREAKDPYINHFKLVESPGPENDIWVIPIHMRNPWKKIRIATSNVEVFDGHLQKLLAKQASTTGTVGYFPENDHILWIYHSDRHLRRWNYVEDKTIPHSFIMKEIPFHFQMPSLNSGSISSSAVTGSSSSMSSFSSRTGLSSMTFQHLKTIPPFKLYHPFVSSSYRFPVYTAVQCYFTSSSSSYWMLHMYVFRRSIKQENVVQMVLFEKPFHDFNREWIFVWSELCPFPLPSLVHVEFDYNQHPFFPSFSIMTQSSILCYRYQDHIHSWSSFIQYVSFSKHILFAYHLYDLKGWLLQIQSKELSPFVLIAPFQTRPPNEEQKQEQEQKNVPIHQPYSSIASFSHNKMVGDRIFPQYHHYPFGSFLYTKQKYYSFCNDGLMFSHDIPRHSVLNGSVFTRTWSGVITQSSDQICGWTLTN